MPFELPRRAGSGRRSRAEHGRQQARSPSRRSARASCRPACGCLAAPRVRLLRRDMARGEFERHDRSNRPGHAGQDRHGPGHGRRRDARRHRCGAGGIRTVAGPGAAGALEVSPILVRPDRRESRGPRDHHDAGAGQTDRRIAWRDRLRARPSSSGSPRKRKRLDARDAGQPPSRPPHMTVRREPVGVAAR